MVRIDMTGGFNVCVDAALVAVLAPKSFNTVLLTVLVLIWLGDAVRVDAALVAVRVSRVYQCGAVTQCSC